MQVLLSGLVFLLSCGFTFSQVANLSHAFSGDETTADYSGKLVVSGTGGFYFFSHRNATFVCGEFDAQGDTLYTRQPLSPGALVADMEIDPLGYMQYAGSDSGGGFIYRSSFTGDSVSLHIATGMEHVLETIIINDTLLAGVGKIVAPDFPVHCCIPFFALYHRDGSLMNQIAIGTYCRINDVLLSIDHQLILAGAHILGYPDGFLAVYDPLTSQLEEIDLATPEPYSIDNTTNLVAIGGYAMNNSVSERYDLLLDADSFYVYGGGELSAQEILFSAYGNTLSAGIRYNNSGADTLLLRCVNSEGEICWTDPLFTGEIHSISDFVSMGNGSYALFATAINDDNGTYDNLLLRFQVNDEAPVTEELPEEMRVRPTVFQDELIFEGLQLVPELIDELNIFDVNGRTVNYLYDLQPGRFTLHFPSVSNGTYFYHVVHNGYTYTGKLIRFKPE